MTTMVSPFEGRVTAQWRGYKGHKGMDIAPPRPGQTGLPVYAAFGGVVVRTARGVKHGNRMSTWAPGRTGNGVLVRNPDGEGNGYNHVSPVVRAGQKIEAGDLIGYNDASGNQTGPHLHFELWKNWKDHNSDYDPRLAFSHNKVTPGSAPIKGIVVKPVANIKPRPQTSVVKSPSASVKRALKTMGLPQNVNGVKAYQRAHGLHPDGVWGARTISHYKYVKALQKGLNMMKSTTKKLAVDGYQGAGTNRRRDDVLRRNNWKLSSLVSNLKKLKVWG